MMRNSTVKPKSTVKVREISNADQISPLPINEKILKECYNMYTDSSLGLIEIGKEFNVKLTPPRKKITILLIGNHSAGKSSFINWYIEEHVQKTGVAIETQGFVLVTSGKRRDTLMGKATLQLYPYFKPMTEIPGLLNFLTTEISTSKQKKFSLVTFIDTPGLVDGNMNYPYDVNEALYWMGGIADLIFVFFDPIGQGLCNRTLNIVERLYTEHAHKVRLYLSKADDAGDEADRQKVMMQIVQELCKRPGLNRSGFDMPCIFVPDVESTKPSYCVNQIDEVCKVIEQTINQIVQNTLNTLETDAEYAHKLLDVHITTDDENREKNKQTTGKGIANRLTLESDPWHYPIVYKLCVFLCVCFLLVYYWVMPRITFQAMMAASMFGIIPFIILFNFIISLIGKTTVRTFIGDSIASKLFTILDPVETAWSFIPEGFHWRTMCFIIMVSCGMCMLMCWSLKLKPTMSRQKRMYYLTLRNHVVNVILFKKQLLYNEYLEQIVGSHDL